MELDKLPGLQRAIARAQRLDADRWDLAFLGVPTVICRQPCLPITPRHLLCLFLGRSPFLVGGRIGPEHVAQFLWIVSPGFQLGEVKAAREFTKQIALKVNYTRAIKQIDAFLDRTLADRPPRIAGPTGSGGTTGSFVASLVHEFAWAYGWSREQTLDTPIVQLYPLLRYIIREDNPKAPLFGGSADKVKGEWLRKRAARQKAKAAPQGPGLSSRRPEAKGEMTCE